MLIVHKDCNDCNDCRPVSEACNLFLPAYIFTIIFSKPKDSLILTRTAWFISVITGLIELLG